jgi:hypothetical protein
MNLTIFSGSGATILGVTVCRAAGWNLTIFYLFQRGLRAIIAFVPRSGNGCTFPYKGLLVAVRQRGTPDLGVLRADRDKAPPRIPSAAKIARASPIRLGSTHAARRDIKGLLKAARLRAEAHAKMCCSVKTVARGH